MTKNIPIAARSALVASYRFSTLRSFTTGNGVQGASQTLAAIETRIKQLTTCQENLQDQIYAAISRQLITAVQSSDQRDAPTDNARGSDRVRPHVPERKNMTKSEFAKNRNQLQQAAKMGSSLRFAYDPYLAFKYPFKASELTLPLLMAAQTHLGHATSLWNPRNSSYIFGIRDGIHIISLDVTFAYLRRAAKVVQEVARMGGLILFVGTRDKQEEIVVRAARKAGGYHIFDRWAPGTLTNAQQILGKCALKVVNLKDEELPEYGSSLYGPMQSRAIKPDLVVCFNPLENRVCLHECGMKTVPTIGVIDTDADASQVTYPIPANDDSIRSISLIAGVLGHAGAEGQRQRLKKAATGQLTYQDRKLHILLEKPGDSAGVGNEARA
jgi:small subunit ribosomal protein S2